MPLSTARFPLAALLATVSLSALAHAADDTATPNDAEERPIVLDDQDVEEIMVTDKYRAGGTLSATKTATPLIDVPQSVSILSAEQIADQALADFGDVLRYTPGASIGQGEGHRDQITIRGQNTTADFFLDGLRDDVQYFRPLYNLERVEILRGSNALIFGRGGGGGIINRVTKRPDLDESFNAGTASVDTFGAFNVAADSNVALNDSQAVRINAFYEDLNNHRDAFGGERFAVNPTFTQKVGDDTAVLLSYEYVDDERVVDRGVPSENGEPIRGFDQTFFGDEDANFTTLSAHILRARVDHSFSDTTSFNATVQYADFDKLYQNLFPVGFDGGAQTVTLDGYRDATDRENFIAQVNFLTEVETGVMSHRLLVGAEYGDQQTDNSREDSLFADSDDDRLTFAFSDPLVIPAFGFPEFARDRTSDVTFASIYAQDQISIGEHVQIIGGIRYDRFEIDVLDRIERANGADDGNDGNLRRVDSEWSPRIGAIYKPVEDISFYASYSKSFLPRSGDQFLTLSLSSQALAPEQFDNYEAGIKWDFMDGLSFTASVFRLDRESGAVIDPNDAGNTLLVGSRTEGIELQLVGALTDNWTINAGYSYLDAKERGRVVDDALSNRTLSQVPEHMASLWTRYNVSEDFGVGLGATYQDAQFASISNAVEMPDFIRFDAAIFYQISDGIDLQLNVENLFNTDYFPAAHNDNNISTGEPLNARFTIRARF